MTVIKCKMCGGDIVLSEDRSIGTCDSCGSTMTLPLIDDEQRAAAFNRGNHFRRIGEFDKALAVYERIVEENEADAEAHWCCALCRFGIEYVEDPATHEWLPTCHRASFDSFLEDVDYLAALEHADPLARERYRQEAEKITEVQRGILSISQNEKPFDVFICYKETDENGQRTRDSLLAQEIYYGLTEEGLRVFFARITLEEKVGTMYEPYIFAALHSARVMVVVGTSAKNLNAVWVRNEWSRFLALMRKDRSKLLLPCYRDMDPYDMPEQLSILQAYDMSSIGFLQDLTRGVNKVLGVDKEPEQARETVVVQGESGANLTALLKRGEMSLEDGEWEAADEFFDRALDMDAECARAYRGKFLASVRKKSLADYTASRVEQARNEETCVLMKAVQADEAHIVAATERFAVQGYVSKFAVKSLYASPQKYASVVGYWRTAAQSEQALLADDRNLKRARTFAAGEFKRILDDEMSAVEHCWNEAIAQAQLRDERLAQEAKDAYAQALKNGDDAAQKQYENATARRESDYQQLCKRQTEARQDEEEWQKLGNEFQRLGDYKDSVERAKQCAEKKVAAQKRARKRKWLLICAVVVITVAARVYYGVIQPAMFYRRADELLSTDNYEEALAQFEAAGGYKDATERVLMTHYAYAEALLAADDYEGALAQFEAAGDYDDASERVLMTHYAYAEVLLAADDYEGALAQFEAAGDYDDAAERVLMTHYAYAEVLLAAGDYEGALAQFEAAGDYDDAAERVLMTHYAYAEVLLAAGDYEGALAQFEAAGDYDDAAERVLMTHYAYAEVLLAAGDYEGALAQFEAAGDYDDAAERVLMTHFAYAEVLLAAGDYEGVEAQFRAAGFNEDAAAMTHYARAEALLAAGDYKGALAQFQAAGNYKGAVERIPMTHYAYAEMLLEQGDIAGAAMQFKAADAYEDARERSFALWDKIAVRETVSAGKDHTVGLKADGTVVAVGDNDRGRCDVDGWTDIVAISAGHYHTVGLKADGTVVATRYTGKYYDGQCGVYGWTDIVAVSAGYSHTVGLKADGTVVATKFINEEYHSGQCDVDGWTDIVAVSAGYFHTVGLKADGTVVAVGARDDGQCDVDRWRNILVRQ